MDSLFIVLWIALLVAAVSGIAVLALSICKAAQMTARQEEGFYARNETCLCGESDHVHIEKEEAP